MTPVTTAETISHRSQRRTRRASAALTAAAVGLTVVGVAPAGAATDVERLDVSIGRFYDNKVTNEGGPDADLLLFAGVTIENVCLREGLDPIDLRVRTKGTPPEPGATQEVALDERVRLALYDGQGLSATELLDEVCPGVVEDGDEVEPLAVGSGALHERESSYWIEGADGPVRIAEAVNSATGTVVTADGERLVVRGSSYITWAPEMVIEEVLVEVLNR